MIDDEDVTRGDRYMPASRHLSAVARLCLFDRCFVVKQFGQFFGHGAAEFFGIHNRHRAAVIARHIMADADGKQFDGRAGFDLFNHMAQMPFEIITSVDRQSGKMNL